MQRAETNHYATLGLDRGCTPAEIRAAYRLLAKQQHPDLNPGSPAAAADMQRLNAACEILSDPARRRVHDHELDHAKKSAPAPHPAKIPRIISRDVNLRIEDFFHGTEREVQIHDPANLNGPETYQLRIPPQTAPGARFRLPRTAPGAKGFVQFRARAMPSFRFKVRGSDLRCDLRIKPERAAQGGREMISGATGAMLRIEIPRGVARGQILRLPGEGLPKPRGGRGDLLVRINYQVAVYIAGPPRR